MKVVQIAAVGDNLFALTKDGRLWQAKGSKFVERWEILWALPGLRKIQQLAAAVEPDAQRLYVLATDGTVWMAFGGATVERWRQIETDERAFR